MKVEDKIKDFETLRIKNIIYFVNIFYIFFGLYKKIILNLRNIIFFKMFISQFINNVVVLLNK